VVHRREGFSASSRIKCHGRRCRPESGRLRRDEGTFRSKLCPDAGSRRRSAGKFRRRSAREILGQASDRTVMLFGLFLTLGVAVLSVALRSYQTSIAQKAGAVGILVSTFLAVYFVSGNWFAGLGAALGWFFLPWLEILTRIRALRLPKEKALRPKSPPSSDVFPTLDEISAEIHNEGFVHITDAGWDWEDYRQFFRIFYKA